jgi:Na+/H+ antiporter NhaC
MSFMKLMSSIPVMFYVSVAAFIVSLVVEVMASKGGSDEERETESVSARKKSQNKVMVADLAMAGLIGFSMTLIYFSWVLVADWRSSTGIFYPESSINPESMPYIPDNEYPPAPPADNK